MRKVGLIFGVLGGVMLSALLLLGMTLWQYGAINFESSEVLGYASMVLALSTVFIGIKSYRDNYGRGSIRFAKGLQVGMFISLVASVMYVATWEAYRLTRPDAYANFFDKYNQCQIDKAREGGATPEELETKSRQIAEFMEMYKNPVIRMGITLMEVLPVGILVTLVSAAVLRRREVLPA